MMDSMHMIRVFNVLLTASALLEMAKLIQVEGTSQGKICALPVNP
jgi:hypothetical protein